MAGTSIVVQVAAGILTLFNVIGGAVRAYIDHPRDDYDDRVREMQEDQWQSVTAELGEVFVEVEESFDPTEVEQEDAPLAARYSVYIWNQYTRGLLDGLEEELENMDEPRETYQQCRSSYDATLPMFAASGLLSLPGVVFLYFVVNPFSLVSAGLVLGIALVLFARGLWKAKQYWYARRRLDEMWEDHHLY